MSIKIVSFDAAHTLVDVNWNPGGFAVQMVTELGENTDQQVAIETYNNLMYSRWGHFKELNLQRNHEVCQGFWRELTADWAQRMGLSTDPMRITEHANNRIYAADSPVYRVFADTVPTLRRLQDAGYRMMVVSNWDVSLHLVMQTFGLSPFFERIFASLEWGPEKPDRELFSIVEAEMNLLPREILHIGDNPIDDFQGARGAGWHAALIDRNLADRDGIRLSTLTQVPDLLAEFV
ncbi:MAG: HAD-IA family hydrolase [Fimbriimonadaceae bacterium]